MTHIPWQKLLIGELSWQRLVQSILFIYVFFAIYIYFRADSMMFLPQPASYQDTKEILKIPVTPTERISALYLPNPKSTYTILFINGNASDLGNVRSLLDNFQQWGFSIFAFDYRGYGTSDGKPGERNAYQDVDAAYTYLTQQLKTPPDRIIVYGQSIGGGSAADLASRRPIAGLILESTFTSAFRVVIPFPILPFDKFTNRDKLKKVRSPVLVMHGKADNIIPFHHGQALYDAAPEPKQHLWVTEAGHDFAWVVGDRYRQALLSFQQLIKNHQQKQ
jgi:abhydrolase domain-containing protein 17